MLAVQTTLPFAQKVKEYLVKHRLVHLDYVTVKEMNFIYFPIISDSLQKGKNIKIPNATVLDTKFAFPLKKKDLMPEDVLRSKLSAAELALIPKTQEIIGTIMVLEIPIALVGKANTIAEAYLQTNTQVTTIVMKEDIHTGEFRTRKVRVLAGRDTRETIHLESGIRIKLDIEQVYFSARTGHERLRVAGLVRAGEKVLVLFAGAAPFPLVIAKHSKATHIWALELNPIACKYAQENVEMNRFMDRITFMCGDARIATPKLKNKFDRIIMPLPKTGEEFLHVALPKVVVGGMIHLYAFLEEKEFAAYRKKIRELCISLGYTVRIVRTVKCGQFAPGTFRVCLDMKMLGSMKVLGKGK